jgi:hypothetical protein
MGSDGTIATAEPRSLIWWRGVPICKRPAKALPAPKQAAPHSRRTPGQTHYAALLLADKTGGVR